MDDINDTKQHATSRESQLNKSIAYHKVERRFKRLIGRKRELEVAAMAARKFAPRENRF